MKTLFQPFLYPTKNGLAILAGIKSLPTGWTGYSVQDFIKAGKRGQKILKQKTIVGAKTNQRFQEAVSKLVQLEFIVPIKPRFCDARSTEKRFAITDVGVDFLAKLQKDKFVIHRCVLFFDKAADE